MLPTQPSHSLLVSFLAPVSNIHAAPERIRCVAQTVRLGTEEKERLLVSLSCTVCDCEFKLNFGTFLRGVGMKMKKQCTMTFLDLKNELLLKSFCVSFRSHSAIAGGGHAN